MFGQLEDRRQQSLLRQAGCNAEGDMFDGLRHLEVLNITRNNLAVKLDCLVMAESFRCLTAH
jgi:hypothetical protein